MRCETGASTMVEILARQAAEQPDGTAYVFLDDRDGATEITFAGLERKARAIAARLQSRLEPGGRALLVYPAGLEFISAFFGCLYAGVIAVPATYPKPKRPMPRLHRIAVDCDAHVALSTAPTLATLDPAILSDATTTDWIATDEVDDALADVWEAPEAASTDLALLQYTSGSTSDPKGVMVSHANLLTNLECIRQAFGIGETDEDQALATGVFWLPAYHDMGLVGGILTPMYMGGRSVLLSPTAFLQRPLRWLRAIHDYQATISGAPNFAYELCVRRISADERAALDLRHWRLAFCGAEPIRAETLSHFADTFRASGFRSQAFYPCYGLAETTLLAAGPDYRREPRILAVNRAALGEHRVVPARGEPLDMTQRLVGCGRAVSGHDIAIVKPETDVACADGEVGEILIQGPSVAEGYWNRPEESEAVFGARVAGRAGRFLRTGDLGFFRDDELFVTGRLKDVIIIRGRNHYPQDIEQTAEQAHPSVLSGAAFALGGNEDSRLVVVHQFDRQYRDANLDDVVRAIRRAIVEQHELDPHAIVLIRQTSLPITSSGKVQRNLCRDQYLAGHLKVVHQWTNPANASLAAINGRVGVRLHRDGVARSRNVAAMTNGNGRTATSGRTPHRPKVSSAMELDRATERIEAWLLEWLVARLGLDAADVARDRPFAEYGVDSLAAVEMSQELEDAFHVKLTPIVAWNYPTPATLARYLAAETTGVGKSHDAQVAPTDDAEERRLADLLAEIENLSEDEAARLLTEDQRN
jgi:acyl-CoA synthetase (AMP-forming)/AMP-acid ligase II/acyl carrier protein